MKTKVLGNLAVASCIAVSLFGQAWAQHDDGVFEGYGPSQPPASADGYVEPDGTVSEYVAGDPDGLWPESSSFGPPGCHRATCCCEHCGGGSSCPSCVYFESGVRILSRNAPRHRSLVFSGVNVFGEGRSDVFTTGSLEYNIAAGYTATLGRYLARTAGNYDEFGEISYWGLNHWDNTQSVDTNGVVGYVDNGNTTVYGNLFTPFPADRIGGFNRFNQATFDVEHTVHNVEANLWLRPRPRADRLVLMENGRWVHLCQPGCYWSHMVGLRAMFIEDEFGMRTLGFPETNGVTGEVWGDYDVETGNNLVGFQVGGDLMFRRCRWSWGGRYRVAPMINFAEQRSAIQSDAVDDPLDALGNFNLRRTADDNMAAVAIELGVVGSYRILPHLVLHAAYDIMWVSGIALAPEQLDFSLLPDPTMNARPGLNTNGTVFYQGLTFSAEMTW